jgi:ribA/ribD-fused uncharacterized protein
VIKIFDGKFDFLSNFFYHPFEYNGMRWKTSEHAFQAMKSLDPQEINEVRFCPGPGSAKRMGRRVKMRPDWDYVKTKTMFDILQCKFQGDLKQRLLDTGDLTITEGNYWHDNFWGDCYCSKCARIDGINMLGRLLMKVRG